MGGNNVQNLREPWKPGQTGNRNGRPKGAFSTRTIFNKWLKVKELVVTPDGNTKLLTNLDAITIALIAKARKGDVLAANALFDRLEGKPKQSVGFTDNEGNDITPINIIPAAGCEPLKDDNESE